MSAGSHSRRADWQERLREPCLSVLLGLQATLIFVVAPLTNARLLGEWAVTSALIALAGVSIFVVARGGVARLLIGGALAVMLALPATQVMFGMADPIRQTRTLASLVFDGTVTWVVAIAVFREGRVSGHRIQGAIVVYLNLALAFALLFEFSTTVLAKPFAIAMSDHTFGEMLYFSLSTLTTTGYGDIVPVHPVVRSLANLEAVIGQLFPATLLASLVGLNLMHRSGK